MSLSRLGLLLGVGLLCGLAIAAAVPASSAMDLAIFVGREIVVSHALPSFLGTHTFSAPEARWFGEAWLGDLGVYVLWAGGGYGALVCASALCAFAVLTLVEIRCRRRGLDDIPTAVAFFFVVASAWGNWRVGGGLCDLLFAAAFMLFVERAPGNAAFGIVPLTIIWCNVSRYGFIAPFFAAFSATGRPFGQGIEQRLHRFALYAAPAAAILLTPATVRAYTNYIAYLDLDPLANLHSWQPVLVGKQAFYGGFLPMTVLASWIGLRRGAFADTLIVLGTMLLVLVNGRTLGIAGVIIAPIVATAAAHFFSRELSERVPGKAAAGVAAVILGAVLIAAGSAALAAARGACLTDGEREQVAFIDALSNDGRAHRLFCSDPDWCSYALRRDANGSRLRVFMDGRYADYPSEIVRDERAIVRVQTAWRRKLDDWKIDAVMTSPAELASLLSLLPDWKRVRASTKVWMFVR